LILGNSAKAASSEGISKYFGSGGLSNLRPALRDFASKVFNLNLAETGEWKNTTLEVSEGDRFSVEIKDQDIIIQPVTYKIMFIKDCVNYPNGLVIDRDEISKSDFGKGNFADNLDAILRGELAPPETEIKVNTRDAIKVRLISPREYFKNKSIKRKQIAKSDFIAREKSVISTLYDKYETLEQNLNNYYSSFLSSLAEDEVAINDIRAKTKLKYALDNAINDNKLTTIGSPDGPLKTNNFQKNSALNKFEANLISKINQDIFNQDITLPYDSLSKYYSYAFYNFNNLIYIGNDVIARESGLYGLYDLTSLFKTNCFPKNSTGLAQSGAFDLSGFMSSLLNTDNECKHINFRESNSSCKYVDGRGLSIDIAGKELKSIDEPFVSVEADSDKFGYYISSASGLLSFDSLPCDNSLCSGSNLGDVGTIDSVFSGNYILEIEVGKGAEGAVEKGVKYAISSDTPSQSGNPVKVGEKITADRTGVLWLKSELNNTPSTIDLRVNNYSGINFVKKIQSWVIDPFINSLNDAAKDRFSSTVNSEAAEAIINTTMTLFIVIYALYYLAGAVSVTYKEILSILVKVTVVSALISKGSWEFFNTYIFSLFRGGLNQLLTMLTSYDTDNIFGFVDLIITRFITPETIITIFAYLLQWISGLFMVGVMIMVGIYTYFKTIFELIIKYIQAFFIINVLIMLAPLFITLMLFERTRTMFDKWVSFLTSTVLAPVISMVMILMLDEIIKIHFYSLMDVLSWGTLLHVGLYFDFSDIHDGFEKLGKLDWDLFDINYFQPNQTTGYAPLTSVFIFMIAIHAARGTNEFADTVVSSLVGTTFVGKGGQRKNTSMGQSQQGGNASAYTAVAKAPLKLAKGITKSTGQKAKSGVQRLNRHSREKAANKIRENDKRLAKLGLDVDDRSARQRSKAKITRSLEDTTQKISDKVEQGKTFVDKTGAQAKNNLTNIKDKTYQGMRDYVKDPIDKNITQDPAQAAKKESENKEEDKATREQRSAREQNIQDLENKMKNLSNKHKKGNNGGKNK
jgi:type IV secretory pathway VirB6-like protein